MAYIALAYFYWASFYEACECIHHTHYRYRLQLPYISHRNYLTNHMGSISHHITPLVINSLGADTYTNTHTQTHTHTQAYRRSRTEAILRNQAHASHRPVRAWFNNSRVIYVVPDY